MSSDSIHQQDTAIILSKLANSPSLMISSCDTTTNMNADLEQASTSRQTSRNSTGKSARNPSGPRKGKSPKVFRRGRSRSRSGSMNMASGYSVPVEQQQQQQNSLSAAAVAAHRSNPKHIKFSLNNSMSNPSNAVPSNFFQRVYTNSGFNNRTMRRPRSNSEYTGIYNRNRSNQQVKPGMSNDYVSREIIDYYQRNRQSNEKYKAKQILRQSLENTLKQTFPNYFINLHIIGSTTNGIGDNAATVDICVLAQKKPILTNLQSPHEIHDKTEKLEPSEQGETETSSYQEKHVKTCEEEKITLAAADSNTVDGVKDEDLTLKHIEKILQSKNFAQNIILIPARVPIIKFNDIICKLNVTLNLNQEVSIRNTQLIRDYSKMDWRFPQLAMIVKEWARENRINSAVEKSISPYSWTLMVIHYLQIVEPPVLPCLQKMFPQRYDVNVSIEEEMSAWRQSPIKWQSKNNNTLKQLMKGLFRYFGYVFDHDQHIISVREGKVLNRIYCQSNRSSNGTFDENVIQWNALMCVEEPFTRTNTTRSVHDHETFERIKELLRMSSNALKGNRISLFNIIIDDLDFPIKY